MVEQGYNYLDGPIHSMAKFFETRIENLEKSIPPSVPSRNNKRNKKGSKKRKLVTFDDPEDEDSKDKCRGTKVFQYHYMCGHTTEECTTHNALVKQAKQKKVKQFQKQHTKHEVNIMVQKQTKKALKQKKGRVLRNYAHSRKSLFPILIKNP